MRPSSRTFALLSWLAAGIVALGFLATIFVALFVTGGHPPPSAYVGILALLTAVALIPLGLIAGVAALRSGGTARSGEPGARAAKAAIVANTILLMVGLVLYLS
jgi:hypothetical protein